MTAYLTTVEAKAILWEDVDEKFLEYASDALDAVLWRFNGQRLWYHEETIVIDLKKGVCVYRPKGLPIKTLSSKTILDEDWNEVWEYEGKIWLYPEYIRLSKPVRVFDKYQYLKLETSSGFFNENEVPTIIKEFVAKVAAKLSIEAGDAGALVSGGTVSNWSKSWFRLGDYSVTFKDGETSASLIKTGTSKDLLEIGGWGELDLIYNQYGRMVAWFIY